MVNQHLRESLQHVPHERAGIWSLGKGREIGPVRWCYRECCRQWGGGGVAAKQLVPKPAAQSKLERARPRQDRAKKNKKIKNMKVSLTHTHKAQVSVHFGVGEIEESKCGSGWVLLLGPRCASASKARTAAAAAMLVSCGRGERSRRRVGRSPRWKMPVWQRAA